MKKILLTLAFLLPIKNSYAEPHIGHLFLMTIVFPSFIVIDLYQRTIDDLKEKSKGMPIPFKKINKCTNLNNFTLNADTQDIYTGIEIPNYSNIQKVQDIDGKLNWSQEDYLCINPKSNFIFKNGCLDILEKDSIKKSSGLWSVNIIFMYDEIVYVQFKNNKSNKTATTELFNFINMLNSNYFNFHNFCNKTNNSKH